MAMLAVGIALVAVVGNLVDGFVGGLVQGAGIGLILVGTFVMSHFLRRGSRRAKGGDDESGRDGLWLPSQDGDR